MALFRTSQALAAVSGRDFVRPDDVKQLAGPVLTHRLILRPESRLRKLTAAAVVAEVVAECSRSHALDRAGRFFEVILVRRYEVVRRGYPAVVGRASPGAELAGVRDVRAAGRSCSSAAGWRGPGSGSLSAVRECNRYSVNVGDTVAVVITLKNSGRLPVAWVLLEDLLPRRAFMYQPPSLQVQGHRIQLAMLKGRGHAHDVLSVAVQSPRLPSDRPA